MASGDPIKLQAQLHKLQAQFDEVTKEKDAQAKELARVKDLNRRGDVELRKAEGASVADRYRTLQSQLKSKLCIAAIILKSREAQQLSLVIEERDTFQHQVRALQDLLRSNAEELEKYRKIIAEGGSAGQNDSATAIKQAELQERITKTRAELKDAEKALSEAEVSAAGAGEAGATGASNELLAKIAALKAGLAQAELEAEAGASEAVKATRARERIEKEARDKQLALENALEIKVKENAALLESMSNLESTHAKDLENFISKLNDRETDLATTRNDLKAACDTVETLKSQVEDTRRKADEETKKAVEKAVDKTKKEIKEKVVDESIVAEYKIKLDAANQAVKQLTEASADTENAKDHAETEVKQLREKLIKREQKLTVVIQEKAEAQSTVKDLEAEVSASKKRHEKVKKELKSCEESLKMTRSEYERAMHELKLATESRATAMEDIASLRAQLASTAADLQQATESLALRSAESDERAQAISQLESLVAVTEGKVEEMKADFQIAIKLTKQLNMELKAQLSAEHKRVTKLERELQGKSQQARAPASPGLSGSTGPMSSPARQPTNSGPSTLVLNKPVQNAGAPVSVNGPVAATVSNVVSRTFSTGQMQPHGGATHARTQSAKNMPDEDDTIRMLGQRLQAVLADAEVAREKVRMLEGIIQTLTVELDEKRQLLKQLTASNSASSGDDLSTEHARAISAALAGENPVSVLKSLLEKTLSENARLRRDLRIIGQDLAQTQERMALAPADTSKANLTEGSGATPDDVGTNPSGTASDGTNSSSGAVKNPFGAAAAAVGNPFGGTGNDRKPRASSNPFGAANPFG